MKTYRLKSKDVPQLSMHEVFVKFYSLESIINDENQTNYIIIRLVTIIEEFCRNLIWLKLFNTPIEFTKRKIELEIPVIDDLIVTVTKGTKWITKEEIIAASYSFQQTSAITNEFAKAFEGLNITEYDKLFELRHKLVHTIKSVPMFDPKEYFLLVEKLMKNILKQYGSSFYAYKIEALYELKKFDQVEQCYNEAEKYYAKIVAKQTTNIFLYGWGLALGRIGKNKESAIFFDKLINKSNDPEAYFWKAVAFEKLGQFRKAMKCYDEVISMDPNDPSAYYNKGLSLQDFGKHRQAISCFITAIGLTSTDDSAFYMAMGKSLQALEKHNDAIRYLSRGIELEPDDAFEYYDLGISLNQIGENNKAKENFVKCLIKLSSMKRFHPIHIHRYSGLAWQRLEVHGMAIECFKQALEFDSNDIDLLLCMGESLMCINKNSDAIHYFDRVLSLEPSNTKAQEGKSAAKS